MAEIADAAPMTMTQTAVTSSNIYIFFSIMIPPLTPKFDWTAEKFADKCFCSVLFLPDSVHTMQEQEICYKIGGKTTGIPGKEESGRMVRIQIIAFLSEIDYAIIP